MIKLITEGMKENVVAVVAHGRVTHQDYQQVLIPALEEKLKTHGKVRFLYHIPEDVTGYTAGALWDDAKEGIRHFTGFEKIAVVTDIHWMVDAINLLGILKPCPVRTFANKELAAATAWLNG